MTVAKPSTTRLPDPTGIHQIDSLAALGNVTLGQYIEGVSAYVRLHRTLADGPKKASQIRLSSALARALAFELNERIPGLGPRLRTEEQKVAGGLRTTNADVSESHPLDGLRLAVELKPVNLAVGRAIWSRYGDIRTFAINIHLKFPFAVVGGVLVIPTYETTPLGTKSASKTTASRSSLGSSLVATAPHLDNHPPAGPPESRKSTLHLIDRAIRRLIRSGGRKTEADAAHLLEGIAVVVYNPDTAEILDQIPERGHGLRWDEFLDDIQLAYQARFEDSDP